MSRHLGERLSALIDGELGHAERERALGHIAACDTCRFEAEMTRSLKRRLHGLDAPAPSTDFMGRLSALSAADSSPGDGPDQGWGAAAGAPAAARPFGSSPPIGSSRPIGGGLPVGPAVAVDPPAAPARTSASRPRTVRAPRRVRALQPAVLAGLRPTWGRARFAVAGVSVVAAALGTAFMAGGGGTEAPVVAPPLDDYALEHALTANQAPLPGVVTVTSVGATGTVPADGVPAAESRQGAQTDPADTSRPR